MLVKGLNEAKKLFFAIKSWFEGNDLRAMEITFPKKKHYLINNPLTNDESSGLDIEHMIDSDKDGITDEVERLRNLNPLF